MHPRARDQLGDFKDLGANFGCNRYSHNLVQCARRALKGNPDSTFDLGYIDPAEDLATPGQPVRPEVVTYVSGMYLDRWRRRTLPSSRANARGMQCTIARSASCSPYPRARRAEDPGRRGITVFVQGGRSAKLGTYALPSTARRCSHVTVRIREGTLRLGSRS